jgi:hypothetical protein
MIMIPYQLPVEDDLIRLVTDHILIKQWKSHQDMNQRIIEECQRNIQLWPSSDQFAFPGHERLYQYVGSEWAYMSMDFGPGGQIPRRSIDQLLFESRKRKMQENKSVIVYRLSFIVYRLLIRVHTSSPRSSSMITHIHDFFALSLTKEHDVRKWKEDTRHRRSDME